MAMDKLFKGILQYNSTQTFEKKPGYIYFVREIVDGVVTGNAEIYFGTRKYGDVQATKLAALEAAIGQNASDIDAIEAKLGEWTEGLGTVAKAVVDLSAATKANAEAITAEETARKEAVSGLQSTLQAEIDEKVAQAEYDDKVAELDGKITAETKARQDAFAAAETATTQAISTAKQEAITSATAYADSLAKNYDASGSAAAVEAKLTGYTATTSETLSGLRNDINAVSGTAATLATSKTDVTAFTEYKTTTDGTLGGLRNDINAVSGTAATLATSKTDVTAFTAYTSATNTTLANIQTALTAANSASVKSVSAEDESILVTGDKEVKLSVQLSSAAGNMLKKNTDGIYAAMYYGGDDAE